LNSSGTYGTNVVADKNGNVYLAGFIVNAAGIEIWDTSNQIKEEITTDAGSSMFIVKFDKTGKYSWSIPLYFGVITDKNISLSCDIEGNIIVSSLQNNTVTVNQRIDNAILYFKDINKVTDSNLSLFTVKYDTNGKCLWTNRLGSNTGGTSSGEIYNPSSAIDSHGNYYLAVQIAGGNAYIYDTRSENDYKYNIAIPTSNTTNTFFAKYNKNGILQWYNFVSGNSTEPSICVDNKFTQGINDNSVYLCGSYTGTGANITLYDRAFNGESPEIVSTLNINGSNSYLLKYDDNGYLVWSSKVGGADDEMNNSIVATSDGHVYLGGEFKTAQVNVYQGATLDMNRNTDIATTINNYYSGDGDITYDIFLIKYNRYGIVNNGNARFGKEIYLENNSSIKNGTEKTIVVINNNEFNGYRENVCLIVLDKNYVERGYSSFRNIWFSEGVSLVSYDGQWFIKSSSNDILPKRSIIMWGGNQTNIPGGWKLCDGGSLNGVTTPDLRGRFVLGYNNIVDGATGVNGTFSTETGLTNLGTGARVGTNLAGGVGNNGGEINHTLTINEMPTHNHGVTDPGHNHTYSGVNSQQAGSTVFDDSADDVNRPVETTGSSVTGITINNTGGSSPHNNLPPFYVLAYIMKCF
jgi:microcystin-dependent protein